MAEQLGPVAQATEGIFDSRHSQDFAADLVRDAPAKVSTSVLKHRIIHGLDTLELLGVDEDINEVVVTLDPGLAAARAKPKKAQTPIADFLGDLDNCGSNPKKKPKKAEKKESLDLEGALGQLIAEEVAAYDELLAMLKEEGLAWQMHELHEHDEDDEEEEPTVDEQGPLVDDLVPGDYDEVPADHDGLAGFLQSVGWVGRSTHTRF